MTNGTGTLDPGVVCIFGPPGTLKTSIGFTWPGKIKVFDTDLGAHRGWEYHKLIESQHIDISRVTTPEKPFTSRYSPLIGYLEVWESLKREFFNVCDSSEYSALMIDTSTLVWRLVQDAYLQELQSTSKDERTRLQQWEFGKPNDGMRNLFDQAKIHHKWLILIHHESDEYEPKLIDGKPVMNSDGNPVSIPTGRKIPDGFKYTRGLSDWIFRTRVDENGDILSPKAKIIKSAKGIDLVGQDMDWFTFEMLEKHLRMIERI